MRAIASLVISCVYAVVFCYEVAVHRPWEVWIRAGDASIEEKRVLYSTENLEVSKITHRPVGPLQSSMTWFRFETPCKKDTSAEEPPCEPTNPSAAPTAPPKWVAIDLSKEEAAALGRVVLAPQGAKDNVDIPVAVGLSGAGDRVFAIRPVITKPIEQSLELSIRNQSVEIRGGEVAKFMKILKRFADGELK